MKVDSNNGSVLFDDNIINSYDKICDLESKFSNKMELWIENGAWVTYRLDVTKKFILMIRFFQNKIQLIEIYPKRQSESQKRRDLVNYLEYLGGEKSYPWGMVGINKDEKAGYESLIIKYK
jgi:hypothetical protein